MTPEFESILSWGGSPQATCGCGRVHFTDSGDFMEPGELPELRRKARAEPDRYIADGENDSVSIATFNGVTAVWGCPCEYLEKVEARLWHNRKTIMEYYTARIAKEAKAAAEDAALLAKLQ